MPADKDTRNIPEMPKRATPTIQIPEAPSLTHKRTRSLTTLTSCSLTSEKTAVKELLTQNHSPTRYKGAGRLAERGSSHHQKGSPKDGISDPKGKHVGSTKVEQSYGKGKRRTPDYLSNGNASSSSVAAQDEAVPGLEALRIGSDDDVDHSSVLLYDDGETSPTLSEEPQDMEVVQDDPEGVEPLLPELVDDILGRLPMVEVLQLRSELGKPFRNAIHRPAFRRSRPQSEGEFSPSFFMTDAAGDLHWHGFDTKRRKWARLPSLNFAKKLLPSPDPDLFKDYLVAGDDGLLCINVGRATGRANLVICNPLTQQVKALPPLKHPRHPVLMHLQVDRDSGHYKVIVAGSAAIGTDALSLKTEEYDSRSGAWECPDGSDLPYPVFGLNEYQNGVHFKELDRELLMCIAIVDTKGRGVLVYDITRKSWAQGLHIPLVRGEPPVSHLATTQIVECGGSVFVFSEQEAGRDVYFVIHKLCPEGAGAFSWDEVVKLKRTGGRGLLVYPEFTCVPVSEHELCIFNTVEHTLEIIDLANPAEVTLLQAPTTVGNRFHSLNPIGFAFRPSFKTVVCPTRRTALQVRDRYCCSERDSDSSVCSILHINDAADFKPQSNPVTVPAKEATVGSPDKLSDRRHNQCGMTDHSGSRPKSWDGVQYDVAAK